MKKVLYEVAVVVGVFLRLDYCLAAFGDGENIGFLGHKLL